MDTVLYFEGEQHHAYRVLRAVKNRFGSTNEIGVFEMGERGLTEVRNPSGFFLAERPRRTRPARWWWPASRAPARLLVEIQALVTPAGFGTPRRTVSGRRLQSRMLAAGGAGEARRASRSRSQDAFVNVAGGARVSEPAADLGLVLAAASSYLDRPAAR